jgi:hypothetical protein
LVTHQRFRQGADCIVQKNYCKQPHKNLLCVLFWGLVVIQSGEQLLRAFGTHLMTLNNMKTLTANRIAAHRTAAHTCCCLPGRPLPALPDEGSVLIAVSGNRFTLPYIAAHHAIHAEPHLTGRIPLNQIILHNPKSVPFRAYKA